MNNIQVTPSDVPNIFTLPNMIPMEISNPYTKNSLGYTDVP